MKTARGSVEVVNGCRGPKWQDPLNEATLPIPVHAVVVEDYNGTPQTRRGHCKLLISGLQVKGLANYLQLPASVKHVPGRIG
eukprot:2337989-Amphidinium_carterae.1